jgi:hypothetical protein
MNFQMNPPKFSSYVYILQYKKEIVLSYLLNTGYIGTYEQNYRLLFNKLEKYSLVYTVFTSKLKEMAN